jgi:hypothetical protein
MKIDNVAATKLTNKHRIKVRYSELRLTQQSRNVVRRIPRDWNRKIHSVNKVPRPNPPHYIYYHRI